MFNPMMLMQLFAQAQQSNNPMMMLQQMGANDPTVQRAMQMSQGKSVPELQQIVRNLAQQRGINPQQLNQMLSQFGLRI